MRKEIIFLVLVLSLLVPNQSDARTFLKSEKPGKENSSFSPDSITLSIYNSLHCPTLDIHAFAQAMRGYNVVQSEKELGKPNIITLIDFSKSSKQQRLYIIDIMNRKIIHQSFVAHGKNSGWDIPEKFSNILNSNQSSLGFYLTAETYTGKHGLSLRLDGLEPGINHNARKRNIVIHSAKYVTDDFIKKAGRLGRSFGCPALPEEDYKEVIDIIKNKSLIYIYAGKTNYLSSSAFFTNPFDK
jgi:hypothetical protein